MAGQSVGHTCAPIGFSELTISGSEREVLEWLRPNELPLRFVDGNSGIRVPGARRAFPRERGLSYEPSALQLAPPLLQAPA